MVDHSIAVHLRDRGDNTLTGAGFGGCPVLGVVEVADKLMCGAFVENGVVVMPRTVNMPRNAWLHVLGTPLDVLAALPRVLHSEREDGADERVAMRRWALTGLPDEIKATLLEERQAWTTWDVVRASIWDLRDGRRFRDADLDDGSNRPLR